VNRDVAKRVAEAAEANDLDAVVALSPENVAYLLGFVVPSQPSMRWRHAGVVLTREARSGILAVDMEAATVREREPDADIRVWHEFGHDAVDVLIDLLRDLGLTGSRVGIETEYVPARDMDALRSGLRGVRWEPAGALFGRSRMIKTPREVELMRGLSRVTDRAIWEALGSVREGDTERDLAAAVTGALYRLGAERHDLLIVASGERSRLPNVGPTDRVLRSGDLVRLEVFGVVQGYHAGVCRTAAVHEAPREARRIWSNLVRCRDVLAEEIRPGAGSSAVYRAFLSVFSELGYEPISFVGHGIGLHLHEEPYLGLQGEWTLEEGMVLGVEPLVYGPQFGLQMKDVVAVTGSGSQRLSDVSDTDRLFTIG
jgi:Xaa-Pro aminopeptidase